MADLTSHYVYAYYDPRNFKVFYIGKGIGKRKIAHLSDKAISEKTKIIKEIRGERLEPIIRVLAKDLTSDQALLVEKTIIWANYESLSNASTGAAFSSNFRPNNTLHKDIKGFDYQTGIYYVNVGEGDHRDWNDCSKFGFICAGGDPKWRDPLKRLLKDDLVVAYLKGKGFVGIGKVISEIQKAIEFKTNGKKLIEFKTELEQPNIFESSGNDDIAQYVVGIQWLKQRTKEDAIWKSAKKSDKDKQLFTTQLVVASLLGQSYTLNYLEEHFQIKFNDYIE
jgi:hypothetical protein